tara:strand:- start:545 stop:1036 length:492 start_codon:yes stop_codon:yes gene_type:complete
MTFDAKQFEEYINDEHTVVSMSHNHAGDDRYIIVMSAYIRPQSPLREKVINPSRNMADIPVDFVRVCPSCGDDWKPLAYNIKDDKMNTIVYHCCSNSIDAETYKRFARGDKVDILPTETDTMARATETITAQPIVFGKQKVTPAPIVFGASQSTGQNKGGKKV